MYEPELTYEEHIKATPEQRTAYFDATGHYGTDSEVLRYNDGGEQLLSVSDTLAQRASRYGDYSQVALTSQRLKNVLYEGIHSSGKSASDIPPYMLESLELICNKLSRVVNGDPLYDDNFRDIAGYAQLVVDHLNKH